MRHVEQHTMESFDFVLAHFVRDDPSILSQHAVVESMMNVWNCNERWLARCRRQLLEIAEQDHVTRAVPQN